MGRRNRRFYYRRLFFALFSESTLKNDGQIQSKSKTIEIFLFCLEISQLSEGQIQNFFVQIEKNFPIG
jgi:hypothetical protein